MRYLERILPPLETADGMFAKIPCYYTFGLADGVRRTDACSSLEDVESRCMEYSARGWNAYFAQAAFGDSSAGRKQLNARALKAFWLDVDVGKERNAYRTREEGLAAIVKFCTETKLPPSYIVSSGFGFYVYWVLTEPMPSLEWRRLAQWLGNVCAARGFVVDPACTSDSARVLRLPGTTHVKSGNAVSVVFDTPAEYTPQDFEAWLSGQGVSVTPGPAAVIPAGRASSFFDSPPTYRAEPIVANCRQMRECGRMLEPSWYAAMSVLKRCVDGREWAHRLSSVDDRYVPGDTDAKFDHAPNDAPATCALFREHAAPLCDGCRWSGVVKSPAEIYRRTASIEEAKAEAEEAETVEEKEPDPEPETCPEPPPGRLNMNVAFDFKPLSLASSVFAVEKRGIVWHEQKLDKSTGIWVTEDHVISTARLFYSHSTRYSESKGVVQWRHWFFSVTASGRTSEPLAITSAEIVNANMAYKFCTDLLVFSTDMFRYGAAVFQKFLNSYVNTLIENNRFRQVDVADTFGWCEVKDERNVPHLEFRTGSGIVTAEGLKPQTYSPIVRTQVDALGHKGDLETWKAVPRLYMELGQSAAMLWFCFCFASVLMPYGGGTATNATCHMWSDDSGRGKTQLLRALSSVWGHPDKQFIKNDSTKNSRPKHLGKLKNIPAFMDEMTEVKDDDLFSLAYTLAGGQEKARLDRSGKAFIPMGTWNLIAFSTANKSMKEACIRGGGSTAAAMLRVIEYECDFLDYSEHPTLNAKILKGVAACKDAYGVAGPEFVYRLLNDEGRLRSLPLYVDNWVAVHGFRNEERFLSNALALAVKAGRWCVEWGILDFDMDALEKWVLEKFVPINRTDNTEYRKAASQIVLEYLMARQGYILRVAEDVRLGRRPSAASADVEYIKGAPVRNEVRLRFAEKEGSLFFSKPDFRNWCAERNMSSTTVINTFRKEGFTAVENTKNLCAGTSRYTTPAAKCIELPHDTLRKLGYVMDDTKER